MNGQRVEGIEQFRRMLHEIPPGRTIALAAMRDGQSQTFSVQLADRTQLATQIIVDLETDPSPDVSSAEPPRPHRASRRLSLRWLLRQPDP